MEKTETTLRHPYEFLNISKKSNKLTRISGVVNAQRYPLSFPAVFFQKERNSKKRKKKDV